MGAGGEGVFGGSVEGFSVCSSQFNKFMQQQVPSKCSCTREVTEEEASFESPYLSRIGRIVNCCLAWQNT